MTTSVSNIQACNKRQKAEQAPQETFIGPSGTEPLARPTKRLERNDSHHSTLSTRLKNPQIMVPRPTEEPLMCNAKVQMYAVHACALVDVLGCLTCPALSRSGFVDRQLRSLCRNHTLSTHIVVIVLATLGSVGVNFVGATIWIGRGAC